MLLEAVRVRSHSMLCLSSEKHPYLLTAVAQQGALTSHQRGTRSCRLVWGESKLGGQNLRRKEEGGARAFIQKKKYKKIKNK